MVDHPAKFSPAIVEVLRERVHLPYGATVLDPFGGVGGIHRINGDWLTYAVELEREWADESLFYGPTHCGDFLEFGTITDPIPTGWPHAYDAVVTSCTYGNRMADSHTPGPGDTSKRITYRHKLERPLTDNNSGGMQWGPNYRGFHILAWKKVHRLLVPGGLFVLNVSDHVRQHKIVRVSDWHRETCERVGFEVVDHHEVPTRRMKFGANAELRIEHENVYVMRRAA